MTSTTVSPITEPDHATARRLMLPVAAGVAVVSAFFELFRADSKGESFSMMGFSVVVTVLVFGLLVRSRLRHESSPVAALVTSVLAALTFVAFWSGLPLVLGAAGALLGYAGKRAPARSGLCIAALVIGVIVVIGYLGLYVSDWITNPGASWHH